MHYVGKLDKSIYKCVTDSIITDEVIITDERVQHTKERRGDAKNSILTAIRENEKRFAQRLRNNTPLYKKEVDFDE